MLTVVITSIPASSSSSTSCQRFSLREPGTFVWAYSSTSATAGARARTASTSISSKSAPRWDEHAARDDLEIADLLGGVRPAVRLDERHDDVGAAVAAPLTLAEHGEGLADAGGGTEVHAERPSSHHGKPVPELARRVEREVELEHVHRRLAEHAERPSVGVLVDESEHDAAGRGRARRATRGACRRAFAGEMWGSRPEPEEVTASGGTSASAASPFSAR